MHKLVIFVLAGAAFALHLAQAQDIAGMEDCTKTQGLDKRTGCFQSNVEYLHRTIAKNAADAHQKLTAASTEISALKKDAADLQKKLAAANGDIAALRSMVARLQASLEQLQNAAKKPEAKEPSK